MNTGRVLASLFVGAFATGSAQAALHDRGGGLIYDDDLNVTWLQDANYAKSSGFDDDGRMTWAQAVSWADGLTYYDSERGVTYDDWRLPTVTDTGTAGCVFSYSGTECGYNIDPTTGEFAHLFLSELGNLPYRDAAGEPQVGYGLVNSVPFINFQSDIYWYGTEYSPGPTYAWYFATFDGAQHVLGKSSDLYAVAVRDGDVAAVPEAQTYAMMLAGLGLLGLRLIKNLRVRLKTNGVRLH